MVQDEAVSGRRGLGEGVSLTLLPRPHYCEGQPCPEVTAAVLAALVAAEPGSQALRERPQSTGQRSASRLPSAAGEASQGQPEVRVWRGGGQVTKAGFQDCVLGFLRVLGGGHWDPHQTRETGGGNPFCSPQANPSLYTRDSVIVAVGIRDRRCTCPTVPDGRAVGEPPQ